MGCLKEAKLKLTLNNKRRTQTKHKENTDKSFHEKKKKNGVLLRNRVHKKKKLMYRVIEVNGVNRLSYARFIYTYMRLTVYRPISISVNAFKTSSGFKYHPV